MKLFKAIGNSIRNLLGVLDNVTEGGNQLSLMFKDVCKAAREEQALESLVDLKALAKSTGLKEADIKAMQAAL